MEEKREEKRESCNLVDTRLPVTVVDYRNTIRCVASLCYQKPWLTSGLATLKLYSVTRKQMPGTHGLCVTALIR